MKLLNKVWPLAVCSIVFYSCEKVVDLNLNAASPQIIIEGIVTNNPGVYQVRISRTVNFSDANNYPPVSGALVVITDQTSNMRDTLLESPAGIYSTHFIQGVSGHSYDLYVSADGQTYTASSSMPLPVALDSLVFEHESFFGESEISVVPYFQDPAGVANYYTFDQFINGRKVGSSFAFGDRLSDGRYITQELRGGGDPADIVAGDTVVVSMNCVDRNVWLYFNSLASQGDDGAQAVAPANPISNISNNALGYFSAQFVQSRTGVAY